MSPFVKVGAISTVDLFSVLLLVAFLLGKMSWNLLALLFGSFVSNSGDD